MWSWLLLSVLDGYRSCICLSSPKLGSNVFGLRQEFLPDWHPNTDPILSQWLKTNGVKCLFFRRAYSAYPLNSAYTQQHATKSQDLKEQTAVRLLRPATARRPRNPARPSFAKTRVEKPDRPSSQTIVQKLASPLNSTRTVRISTTRFKSEVRVPNQVQ